MEPVAKLKVGDTVWTWDGEDRHQEEEETITKVSRTHYTIGRLGRHRVPITRESPGDPRVRHVSTGYGYGITVYLDRSAIDDRKWMRSNRKRIVDAVERGGIELLKRIDALLAEGVMKHEIKGA